MEEAFFVNTAIMSFLPLTLGDELRPRGCEVSTSESPPFLIELSEVQSDEPWPLLELSDDEDRCCLNSRRGLLELSLSFCRHAFLFLTHIYRILPTCVFSFVNAPVLVQRRGPWFC